MCERGSDEPHWHHATAFGFNVGDLEETHRRAVAAGALEHFLQWMRKGFLGIRAFRIRAATASSSGRPETTTGGARSSGPSPRFAKTGCFSFSTNGALSRRRGNLRLA